MDLMTFDEVVTSLKKKRRTMSLLMGIPSRWQANIALRLFATRLASVGIAAFSALSI